MTGTLDSAYAPIFDDTGRGRNSGGLRNVCHLLQWRFHQDWAHRAILDFMRTRSGSRCSLVTYPTWKWGTTPVSSSGVFTCSGYNVSSYDLNAYGEIYTPAAGNAISPTPGVPFTVRGANLSLSQMELHTTSRADEYEFYPGMQMHYYIAVEEATCTALWALGDGVPGATQTNVVLHVTYEIRHTANFECGTTNLELALQHFQDSGRKLLVLVYEATDVLTPTEDFATPVARSYNRDLWDSMAAQFSSVRVVYGQAWQMSRLLLQAT